MAKNHPRARRPTTLSTTLLLSVALIPAAAAQPRTAQEPPGWARIVPSDAERILRRYGGHYRTPVDSTSHDTEIDIQRGSGDDVKVKIDVVGPDHYSCSVIGLAHLGSRGQLLVEALVEQPVGGASSCRVELTMRDRTLTVTHLWPSACRSYFCGTRAYLVDSSAERVLSR